MPFKRTVELPRIGDRFGRLIVIRESYKQNGRWVTDCQCNCGNQGTFDFHNLRNGNTVSCGCYEKDHPGHLIHGGKGTRLFTIWSGMRQRCKDETGSHVKWYSGRGIKVCEEWQKDFAAFRDWAIQNGYQDNLEIDRINQNGNYSPDNCRWVTHQEQMNNMSRNHLLIAFGETKTMIEWSKDSRCQVSYTTLRARINERGWNAEKAILTKV